MTCRVMVIAQASSSGMRLRTCAAPQESLNSTSDVEGL